MPDQLTRVDQPLNLWQQFQKNWLIRDSANQREDDSQLYRRLYGPSLPAAFSSDIPGYGARRYDDNSKPYQIQPGVGVPPDVFSPTSYGVPYRPTSQNIHKSYFPAINDIMKMLT